ncbi:MAG: hypothetical protein AAB683_01170 [Patescibacteria group bacterium]
MEYSKEQKLKIYETLPQELKDAITSIELPEKIDSISKKYSLMLDKVSELSDEVVLFMLGLTKQNNFVANISRRLDISNKIAINLSKDINTEIFDPIRSSLQQIQSNSDNNAQNIEKNTESKETKIQIKKINPVITSVPTYITPVKIDKDISNIEKIGDFTIEKEMERPIDSRAETNESMNRNSILKEIEHPESINGVSMIDHLLTTPVNTVEKVIEKKIAVKNTENDISRTDPYREAI